MTAMYLIFVVGVLVVMLAGLLVGRSRPVQSATMQRALVPLGRVLDSCRQELGRHFGALAVLLMGAAAAVIITWPFGRMAKRFTPHIDRPFLDWTRRHVSNHGAWHHANAVLTKMGNLPEIKIICVAAAVVFGVVWALQRRSWWVPALVMAATFGFEKYGQSALGAVVARHRVLWLPDFGNFPSGGCARLITVYGMVFYLALLSWPAIRRGWRVTGWTVLAVLAFVEGYTRVFLIKHWGMDVVGGLLFGTLMLLALIAAASCFARTDATGHDRVDLTDSGRVRASSRV